MISVRGGDPTSHPGARCDCASRAQFSPDLLTFFPYIERKKFLRRYAMAGTVKSRFPQTIDRPMLMLLWELDEFALFVIPSVISLFMRKMIFGIVIGYLLMKLYAKLKEGRPNNFVFHLAWKFGIVKVKDTPPTFVSKFME